MKADHFTAHHIETLESRRLLSAGALDPSFSGDGKATLSFGPLTAGSQAMAVQSDGRIVELGSASGGLLALARLNSDGTPDTTFGPTHNGEVVTGYAGSNDIAPEGVAIQPDGKIVVAATRGIDQTFDILRFNPDGSFDHTFDGDGVVNVDVGFGVSGGPAALTLQRDGKIVVAGEVRGGLFTSDDDFLVVRLNSNGSLDNSFADSGETQIDFGGSESANAVAIDYNGTAASNPDFGHIVVVGDQTNFDNGHQVIAVARLNPNGSMDHSFDSDGQRLASIAGPNAISAGGVVVEGNGRVITAGSAQSQFLLMGFTGSGATDTHFGTGGVVRTTFSAGAAGASSIINGFDGHIIVGGHAGTKFAVAAYSLDGKIDTRFGTGGKVTTSIHADGKTFDGIDAMALGPNRTIVAAGGQDFATARYTDLGPSVAVTAIITTASEHGPQPETFLVTRDERLPFPTRVYFNISGTATAPTLPALRNHSNDYTLSGMAVPQFVILGQNSHPFVDIAANETFAQVTLTPIDDKRIEGTETATFTINTDPFYDIATPNGATISIKDDVTAIKDIADAHVTDGGSANTNFGKATQVKVKNGTTGQNRVAFLKFDLTGITSVNSVQLQLFGQLSAASTSGIVTQVFAVPNTSWSETAITFNNKPAPSGAALASATITGTTLQLYTFDLTAFIKSQLAAGHKVITLELKNPSVSTPIVLFNSREAASNGPQLVIA